MTTQRARSSFRFLSSLFVGMCAASGVVWTQQTPPNAERTTAGRTVVGYVGDRTIYLDDLDRAVQAQLFELEDQAYKLRKNALEIEIDRILLDALARTKGVDVTALRRELATAATISDNEIDAVYQKSKTRFAGTPEAEVKDRLRVMLQRDAQRRAYHEKVRALRQDAKVQVLLRRPMLAPTEFAKLSGPVMGSTSDAAVKVVVFSDYQCPYCRRAEEQLGQLLTRYTDRVQLTYLQFPLDNHPQAQKAAEASLCASEQGSFREYHTALFRQSQDLSLEKLKGFARELSLDEPRFVSCLDSGKMAPTVDRDRERGVAIGVRATPTIVIDREVFQGLPPAGELDAAVQRAIEGRRQDKSASAELRGEGESMMVERYSRVVIASLTLVLMSASGAAAQPGGWCRGFYDVENRNRHVVGDVNVECGGISIHSPTWGNWGVSSNLGDLTNSAQFFGWHTEGTQAHWNSCTGDHHRDEDAVYYNHDHNGNGLGDDQWSPWPNPYASAAVDFETDCPVDYNSDGQCDAGGCFRLSAGAGFSGHFLSLYELDTPDGDDFVSTLYVDGNCCHFTPSFCNAQECGSGQSEWYETTSFNGTEAKTEVRMKMSFATFTPSNYCLTLRDNYFQYNCS